MESYKTDTAELNFQHVHNTVYRLTGLGGRVRKVIWTSGPTDG